MFKSVKTIVHKDGKRRVVFWCRENGTFFYEQEYWDEDEYHSCWVPYGRPVAGIYDSLETAEREATGNISWLAG